MAMVESLGIMKMVEMAEIMEMVSFLPWVRRKRTLCFSIGIFSVF